LPTPGHIPRKILSFPRFCLASSRLRDANSASGSGRLVSIELL